MALQRAGHRVGVLDADITGPSIPQLFGLPAGGLRGPSRACCRLSPAPGIKVMSINLLLPEEDTPSSGAGR